jgi:poly(A) polymerase
LGIEPKDYDVATDATPDQVASLFPRHVAIGVSFGVIRVLGPNPGGTPQVEVATFRSDGAYSDGRRPDAVAFASAREDALRRDFTINGMFHEPIEGHLIDYVGGEQDLANKVLRAIGSPAQRFTEDKLRLLRAVRFAARFELSIDTATQEAIRAMAREIRIVSAERIADELRRLLVDAHRARALNLMLDFGLVAAILPELLEMKDLPQGPPQCPTGDLWSHVVRVLDLLGPSPSFPLALAALLHDVGKRRTLGRTPDRFTFYSHEEVSRRMTVDICARLKLSNAEAERAEWLVKKHQYLADAPSMRPSKLKQTLVHPGIHELLELHRADALASGRSIDHVLFCEAFLDRSTAEELNPPALVSGHDLESLGIARGPIYKQVLDAVREAQLDGAIRTKADALRMTAEWIEAHRRQSDAPHRG